jgi:hypothetical protein
MSRTVQYKNAKLVSVLISTFLLFAVAIAPLKASAWTGFYFNGA